MASNRLNLAAAGDNDSSRAEKTARDTLDHHMGRATTDAEWATARARLLEFVAVLRSWDLPVLSNTSEGGKVVLMLQPRSGP